MPNETTQSETAQQVTNDSQTQDAPTVPSPEAQPAAEHQEQPSEVKPEVKQEPVSVKKTHNDRIAELESKIAKMEALYQLQGQNVVDMEVCTDLLLKGYTLEQLKQSKPYLFGQNAVASQGVVKQPPKVVTETQTPKTIPSSVSSEGFVKTLANMLISKF